MRLIDIAIEANRMYQNVESTEFVFFYNEQKKLKRISLIKRISLHIYKLLRSVKDFNSIRPEVIKGKNLYLYETLNQKRGLTPVFDKDSRKQTVSISSNVDADVYINELVPLLIGLLSLPIILLHFFCNKDVPIKHRILIDKYMISVGYYVYYKRFFQRTENQVVIVSNDHNSRIRALVIAARYSGIPVVYIQHASVSECFPPLDLFDLAFLDGQSSLNIYANIGLVKSKVLLYGAIRNFNLSRVKKESSYGSNIKLGIAINGMVDTKKLEDLLGEVFSWNPLLEINLRLHPAQQKDLLFYQKNFANRNVSITGYWVEGINDFMDNIDVLLSGSSSIHLEALKKWVLPVLVDIEKNTFDYYGYLKGGCVLTLREFKITSFNTHPLIIERLLMNARYFDASIMNMNNENKKLISNAILEIDALRNSKVNKK